MVNVICVWDSRNHGFESFPEIFSADSKIVLLFLDAWSSTHLWGTTFLKNNRKGVKLYLGSCQVFWQRNMCTETLVKQVLLLAPTLPILTIESLVVAIEIVVWILYCYCCCSVSYDCLYDDAVDTVERLVLLSSWPEVILMSTRIEKTIIDFKFSEFYFLLFLLQKKKKMMGKYFWLCKCTNSQQSFVQWTIL